MDNRAMQEVATKSRDLRYEERRFFPINDKKLK